MNGAYLPYHLRHNKAIERQIFIDLLSLVHREEPMSRYTYIGFGGPLLEDFRAIHTQLGIKRMISLELNPDVIPRQKFNRPHKCIEVKNISSSEYISSLKVNKRLLFWLDFTSPADLGKQLGDFEALITKLQSFDVVKITLNANLKMLTPSCWVGTPEECAQERLKTLRKRGGPYVDDSINTAMMSHGEYPKALARLLQRAANGGLSGRPNLVFQPLATFVYSDSSPMMTLTGIILKETERNTFLDKTTISSWDLRSLEWGTYREIAVPILSVRERLKIDRLLPTGSDKGIFRTLGFKIADDGDMNGENATELALKNYREYYRHLPYFSRIVV